MLTTVNDTVCFLHRRRAWCCLPPPHSNCWLVHCAGAEDVLSDSHLQSSTLAMPWAHMQVLLALTLLLTQLWYRWCTGPLTLDLPKTPSHTHTNICKKRLVSLLFTRIRHQINFSFLNNALNFILIYYTTLLSDSTNQSIQIQFFFGTDGVWGSLNSNPCC